MKRFKLSYKCKETSESRPLLTESSVGKRPGVVAFSPGQDVLKYCLRHMFFDGVFDQMEGMKFIPEGALDYVPLNRHKLILVCSVYSSVTHVHGNVSHSGVERLFILTYGRTTCQTWPDSRSSHSRTRHRTSARFVDPVRMTHAYLIVANRVS